MSRLRSWLTVLSLSATQACGSQVVKNPESPVRAVEVTEDGAELAIPPTGVTDIDENSSVKLVVDKSAAQAALSSSIGADTEKLPGLVARIESVNRAIKSQQAALSDLTAKLSNPPSPKDVGAAIGALGLLERSAMEDLKAIATRAEINVILSAGSGSFEAAIEHLTKQSGRLQVELDAITQSLKRVRWRMQAALYAQSGRQDLHLDGYDELTPGDPNIINKLAIPRNLLSTIDQAQAAAADLGNLKTALGRARDVLAERVHEFSGRLLKIADGLQAVSTSTEQRAKDAPWATTQKGRPIVSSAGKLVSDAQGILASCRDGFETTRALRGTSASALVGLVNRSDSSVRKCVDTLRANGPSVVAISRKLSEQIKDLRQAAATDVNLAKSLAAQTTVEVEGLVSSIEATAVTQFIESWDSVQGLFAEASKVGSGPIFASAGHAVDHTYRDLSDTRIDLVRSPRAPGNLVYYRAVVVTDDKETQQWSSAPMRVVATGWHVDVSASVVFVRALKTQAQDSAFPAAPAATAAIHYGSRRGNNENRGNSVWNFVNPGLGLHVAYLDLGPKVAAGSTTPPSNPATEVGVGGTLQLFGDVLQAGLAYDLQVQRPYAFFGVGLQTATSFGITVPTTGRP